MFLKPILSQSNLAPLRRRSYLQVVLWKLARPANLQHDRVRFRSSVLYEKSTPALNWQRSKHISAGIAAFLKFNIPVMMAFLISTLVELLAASMMVAAEIVRSD